jgi:hypothetical protein
MLDEALDIVTRLWSGAAVDHVGPHYRVEGARFVPTPVQQPRIPIWVGGVWPNRRPMRRAARWDGVIPLFSEWQGRDDQLRGCIEFIRQQRATEEGFDVVYPGISPGDRPDVAAAEVAVSGRPASPGGWRPSPRIGPIPGSTTLGTSSGCGSGCCRAPHPPTGSVRAFDRNPRTVGRPGREELDGRRAGEGNVDDRFARCVESGGTRFRPVCCCSLLAVAAII